MRILFVAVLSLGASLVAAQQPAAGDAAASAKLSIPAELSKTVRADKARLGDPVEFKTLEAVLVSKDLVMPANALLHGRVLSAGPKQEGKNSWLAVVVERAEWKQHSILLHAFIAAQIRISSSGADPRAADPGMTQTSTLNRRAARMSARIGVGNDPSLSNVIKPPRESTAPNPDELSAKHPMLENVGIVRAKDGTTYLLSSKTDVKLPAGTLLMLKNEPVTSPQTADAKPASIAGGADRQP